MPYGRTRQLPESGGHYRELSRRMFVMAVSHVRLTQGTRMLLLKII